MKAGCQQLSEKTVQSGWLTKCGGTGIKQNWRKRWFVLTYDKILYYYKTPQVRARSLARSRDNERGNDGLSDSMRARS